MTRLIESLEARRLLAGYILDPRFGGDGVIDTRDAALGEAVPTQTLVDPQGRLVVVTPYSPADGGTRQLAIRRYRTDGFTDTTLDGDGKLVIDLGLGGAPDPLVTLLHDGSIVVALRQARKPLLQRYTAAGLLDSSFARNAGSNYKVFGTGSFDRRRDRLYTDASGRAVFMQYRTGNGGLFIDPTLFEQTIAVRASRYLSGGSPDSTFGTRGGLDVSQAVDSPPIYRFEGRYFHRRDEMFFTEPQIDADDNLIVGGSRMYARGSGSGAALDLTRLNLPFVYSFDRTGEVNRHLVEDIDPDHARFEGLKLRYTGPQVVAGQGVLTPDGAFYLASGTSGRSERGLVIFKPGGNTFEVVGSDPRFIEARLHVFGNRTWALIGAGGVNRLAALNEDATVGETMGLKYTFIEGPLPYNGVAVDRPRQVYGFDDFRKLDVRRVYLTLQEGVTSLDESGTLRIAGTAGDDLITIEPRSTGRYVVTGAGRTRSFAQADVQRIDINSAGGDDLVDAPFGLDLPCTLTGSAGDDTIGGGRGADLIIGGSGDDWLMGAEGDDTLRGESGDDRLEGNAGVNHHFGGSGNDRAFFRQTDTYEDVEEIV